MRTLKRKNQKKTLKKRSQKNRNQKKTLKKKRKKWLQHQWIWLSQVALCQQVERVLLTVGYRFHPVSLHCAQRPWHTGEFHIVFKLFLCSLILSLSLSLIIFLLLVLSFYFVLSFPLSLSLTLSLTHTLSLLFQIFFFFFLIGQHKMVDILWTSFLWLSN